MSLRRHLEDKIEDWRSYGRGFYYRVHTDDPKAPNTEWAAAPDSVRARADQPAERPPNDKPIGGQPREGDPGHANNGGAFKVGDRVDTFYDQTHGHNRGNVIAVGNGKYQVHYNGCKTDEWVDASLVRPRATISAAAPEITFLFYRQTVPGPERSRIASSVAARRIHFFLPEV